MKRALMLLLLLCSVPGYATTLQTLQEQDKLRLRSWLEPSENIVVGQEVQLIIEIATPRWFAGGTRIEVPEIANLVALRRNEFAVNSSRREGGVTWVVQQWQLELYPQQRGEYTVPPLTLELAVNEASAGIVRGRLTTTALDFEVTVPALLKGADSWLATPSLKVEQDFNRELYGLVAGDAFERQITLRATRVTAMMLPEPGQEIITGLAAYTDNPQLQDRSNRGEATAIRREVISYVVEQAGQYQLPEQEFLWWDTSSSTVRTAVLPAVSIDAGEPALPTLDSSWLPDQAARWAGVLLLLLTVVIATAVLVRRRKTRPVSERQLLRQSARALRQANPKLAIHYLYAWLNRQASEQNWLSLRDMASTANDQELSAAAAVLLRSVFAADDSQAETDKKLASRLAAGLRRARSRRGRQLQSLRPIKLQLNPSDQPRK